MDANESAQSSNAPEPVKKNWNRRAIIVSIIVNGLIIIALGFCYISFRSDTSSPMPPPVTQSAPEPEPPAEPEVVPLPGEKAQDTVNRVLEEQTQAAAARSDEENLTVLEEQGERLKKVSSEASIDQIADQFHSWTGTEKRVTEPVKDAPMQTEDTVSGSNFDTETAQFYDVKKIRSKTTSEIKYKAVLIDAQGRTMSMDLPKDDGERLYPIFKQMKQNPLMGQIYKKIVMPIIDKQLNNLRGQENE